MQPTHQGEDWGSSRARGSVRSRRGTLSSLSRAVLRIRRRKRNETSRPSAWRVVSAQQMCPILVNKGISASPAYSPANSNRSRNFWTRVRAGMGEVDICLSQHRLAALILPDAQLIFCSLMSSSGASRLPPADGLSGGCDPRAI